MIKTHTQLINALIGKYSLKSYCEIGLQKRSNNFDQIKCDYKFCIDPDINASADFIGTSDDFFKQNERRFSLFFIDGYHSAEQVKRDFENCINNLEDGGYIIAHDVLPENEQGTKVPRETKVWWGDVYKFAMSIRNNYSDIQFITFNVDNGCMLVWKEPGYTYTSWNEAPFNWETYLKYGKILMNVVDEVII